MAEVTIEQLWIQLAQGQQQMAEVLGQLHGQRQAGGGNSSGLKPSLPIFHGRQGVDNVRKFRAQLQTACDATGTPKERQVAIAAAQLRGQASEWWFSLTQLKGVTWTKEVTIDEFFLLLETNFTPHNYNRYILREMRNCRQNRDIHDYINRYSTLANQLSVASEFDKVWTFVDGLKPQTRYQVEAHAPETLQEAYRLATNYDSAFSSVHASVGRRTQDNNKEHKTPTYQRANQTPTSQPMDVDAFTVNQGRPKRDMSKVVCHNCKETGHYQYHCPNKTGQDRSVRAHNVEADVQDSDPDADNHSDDDWPTGNEALPFV